MESSEKDSSAETEINNQDSQEALTAEVRDADFSALEAVAGGKTGSFAATAEIAALKAEADANKDKYLRALAELENFKKCAVKERSELLKYQGDRLVTDLLDVLDNLELALSHTDADPAKLKAGLELIHKQFVDVLGRWEIRAVPALGTDFDPVKHQAISKVTSAEHKAGSVISEFKKAYFYKDKLLRHAAVVVAVAAEGTEPKESDKPSE